MCIEVREALGEGVTETGPPEEEWEGAICCGTLSSEKLRSRVQAAQELSPSEALWGAKPALLQAARQSERKQ